METILAIDLGKYKSVFCKLDTTSLRCEYFTVRSRPQEFHDAFIKLNQPESIVLFEVGAQAGWLADMLRTLKVDFKVTNVNNPAWRWSNNQNKTDKADAHRLAMMYHRNASVGIGHFLNLN